MPGWGIRVFTAVFEFTVGYGYDDAISNRDQSAGLEPCAEGDNVHRRPGAFPAGRTLLALIGHRASVGGSVGCADCCAWMARLTSRPADSGSTIFSCWDVCCTAGSTLTLTFCGTDWVLPAGYQVLFQKISMRWTMDANGLSVVDNHAGITFGVELYVPWDAPEAVVDISSADVVPMRNVPDVIGLVGRRDNAVESRVLQDRDTRSV